MRLGARHLCYCTNIHAAETLDDVRAMLSSRVAAVKARVSPDRPFGVGLRLSARAVEALAAPGPLAELRGLLDDHGLYVLSLDGAAYGPSDDATARGLQPDWLDERRIAYTEALAHIGAALAPEDVVTINTLAGALRERVRGDGDVATVAGRLRWMARFLERVQRQTGKTVVLAIEPSPAFMLGSIEETITFFRRWLVTGSDEPRVRRHLGVCIDGTQLVLDRERLDRAVRSLREFGIRIAKLQLSPEAQDGAPTDAAQLLSAVAETDCPHIEVERARISRDDAVEDTIARELGWAMARL